MIKRFRVQNYKALRDVTLDLTPIHVLIGPNDSGKTSILEALRAVSRSVSHPLQEIFPGTWDRGALVWNRAINREVMFQAIGCGKRVAINADFDYSFGILFELTGEPIGLVRETFHGLEGDVDLAIPKLLGTRVWAIMHQGDETQSDLKSTAAFIHECLIGDQFYAWNPRQLRLPAAPDHSRRFRMDWDGFGLATCLDDILGNDRAQFDSLENEFKNIFPDVLSIHLRTEQGFRARYEGNSNIATLFAGDGKGIHVSFKNKATTIAAAQLSDGMIIVLAYLAILYQPYPPQMLLIEEPENGIHPERLREVLTILRNLVERKKGTQIILTTHSPYALDQFKPEEVTLCRKESDGAVSVHKLSESKVVKEQINLFTLGEIWTSEGDDALVEKADDAGESAT